MRFITFLFFAVLILMWLSFGAYFADIYHPAWLPAAILALKRPATTADFGQSFAVLDGLLSSVAVVLGLVAILLQGRELKESTRAQTEQAKALSIQIEQQNRSNLLGAFAARIQFLLTEAERLEGQINRLVEQARLENNSTEREAKWSIVKNSRSLQLDYRKQAKEIDQKIQQLLAET